MVPQSLIGCVCVSSLNHLMGCQFFIFNYLKMNYFFFNKLKWDILTTMIHPAQGVQMANHPRVFTRSKWLQQGNTIKTETNYKWTLKE